MNRRNALVAVVSTFMIGAAVLAQNLRPQKYFYQTRSSKGLDRDIPRSFTGWTEVPEARAVVADPTQTELADKIYAETVTRVYRNRTGEVVYLVAAYGKDQSSELQVHTPELCYPANGLPVLERAPTAFDLNGRRQSAVRLVASRGGSQKEAVLYWVVIGDHVVNGTGRERQDVRFLYGFKGYIPDGLLFRISVITGNTEEGFEVLERFAKDFFVAVDVHAGEFLRGKYTYE